MTFLCTKFLNTESHCNCLVFPWSISIWFCTLDSIEHLCKSTIRVLNRGARVREFAAVFPFTLPCLSRAEKWNQQIFTNPNPLISDSVQYGQKAFASKNLRLFWFLSWWDIEQFRIIIFLVSSPVAAVSIPAPASARLLLPFPASISATLFSAFGAPLGAVPALTAPISSAILALSDSGLYLSLGKIVVIHNFVSA